MLGTGWGIMQVAVTRQAGFRPESLQPAAFYNVAASGACWQDVAGTVPALAAGDPVARLSDLSGQARHLVQTVPAARPLLQVAGAHRWLEFDGIDDSLVGGPVHVAVRQIVGSYRSAVVSSNTHVIYGAVMGGGRSYVAFSNGEFSAGVGSHVTSTIRIAGAVSGAVVVASLAYDGARVVLRRDGITGYDAPQSGSAAPGFAAALGGMNRAGSVDSFFKGSVHALIDMGRLLTATEQVAVERWLGEVCRTAV